MLWMRMETKHPDDVVKQRRKKIKLGADKSRRHTRKWSFVAQCNMHAPALASRLQERMQWLIATCILMVSMRVKLCDPQHQNEKTVPQCLMACCKSFWKCVSQQRQSMPSLASLWCGIPQSHVGGQNNSKQMHHLTNQKANHLVQSSMHCFRMHRKKPVVSDHNTGSNRQSEPTEKAKLM